MLAGPGIGQNVQATGTDRYSSDENELLMMGNPLIITASQTKQRVSDSPMAISVITEDDIRKSGYTSVTDLLRSIPGVDVMEGNRSQVNVVIRGFNFPFAASLLVMVDGHSIYQDSFGGTFWTQEPLLMSQIKQIEVVRGPGSVLYGANAFGGVINIITKTPAEMAKDGKIALLAAHGEENSTVTEGSYTGSVGKAGHEFAYTVGGGFHGTDGIGELKSGAVRDSYSMPIFTFRGTQALHKGSLNVAVATAQGKIDVTTPYTNYVDAASRTNRFVADYKDDAHHLTISGRVYGTAVTQTDDNVVEETNTQEFTIQQQQDPSPRHEIIYGASYRGVRVKSTDMGGATKSDHIAAIFAQDQYEVAHNTHLFTGIRVDNHSIYGTDVSPRVSLVRHLDDHQTLRLSYSSAFQDPTLFDTYFNVTLPFSGLPIHVLGDTSLKPEKINGVELGYRRDLPKGYVEASLFHDTITDLLGDILGGFVQPPGFPFPIPTTATTTNNASAIAQGFELDGRLALNARTNLRANYSYLDTQMNRHQAEFSPRNHVNVSVDSQLTRRINGYVGMRYVDSNVERTFTAAPVTIGSYVDFDGKLGYKLADKNHPWEIAVTATNLFNVPHMEMPNVPVNGQPTAAAIPRRVWLQLSGNW